MKVIKDLGKTVDSTGKTRHMVLVKCSSCGVEKTTRKDMPQKTEFCRSCAKQSHGDTGTRLYTIWCNMKARCNNPNSNRYEYYGAKGIKVCTEWEDDYQNFKSWAVSNGYSESLTIDRKDSNKGYHPENCRWADTFAQAVNKKYPTGKSGYHGVTTRHILQIRSGNTVLLSKDCDSAEAAAIEREIFIVVNKLEHTRNFPGESMEDLEKRLEVL